MKRIISCLVLVTLILASLLAVIPASAAVTEKNVMGDSNANKQFAGEGNVFYYDYHKFLDLGNQFPVEETGNTDFMIRYHNDGNGSASVCDGIKTSGAFNHGCGSELSQTIGTNSYNHVFGYSFKNSVVVDGIKLYLPLTATTNDGDYTCPITEIDVYGASADVANKIFAKESEKTLLASFKNVNTTPTTEVTEIGTDGQPIKASVIKLEAAELNEALKIDYIIFGIKATGRYKFYEIQLNGVETGYADFDPLKKQIAAYNQILAAEAECTPASWANLKTAVENATPVNKNASSTQEEINAAAAAILTAINSLEVADSITVDKTALNTAITTAQTKVEKDYTPKTWTPFKAALDAALIAQANEKIAPTPLAIALNNLNATMNALIVRPDLTAFNAKLSEIANLKEADYTPMSWEAFQKIVAKATALKTNEDATQADVDAALAELESAIKNVLAKPGDKTKLIAAIEAAKKLEKKNYDTSAMTWGVFEMSIDDAQTIVDDPNATQGAVDLALETLEGNIKKLGDPVSDKPSTDDKDANDDADAEDGEDEEGEETEAPATQAPATQAPATTPAPEKKGGCGSSVALSALAIVGVIGTAVVLKKRN